ncbi:hypothetical protein LZQ00_00670 [Sphingobacterium sp. SRCM116780]|uniref:hypothetical protein n=1 Tax=Sphingobacterium sp. SRCM116780 TaxID=2907623 RepID=UPI001F2B10E7|nr:hypothetical protein [Sphingobacterium sp. SRCM116780]UIR56355.1 hypothetical protein LZQ00_00670 [Sphingobacterium sp. SRCM116780]
MFIPESHFFTDTNGISQTAEQSFGPKDVNTFDVTARFSSTGGMAYALCKSVVFIQPQEGNSQLVNLILRPYQQPITGLNIRYIVYRGLRRQDFFTGELVLPPTAAQTDFIRKVNKSFDDFYEQTKSEKPTFETKYIGFDPANQQDSETLDSYFFKESEVTVTGDTTVESATDAFELPMVQAGDSLGFFQTGECGIDIVLGYGDYKLENAVDEFVFDLAYARKSHVKIDVANVTTAAQKKRVKEQATQFIDVAAFYGFHVENGSVTVNDNGSPVKTKGLDIYNNIVSKFYSKNTLYLYIQGDRGRSYNFYGNYSLASDSNFNIKVDGTGTNFGKNEWPVHVVESTQQHEEVNNLTIIQLLTDSNPEAMLYVQVGDLTNAVKNNFMNATALKAPEDPNSQTSIAYTPDLLLSNPSVGTTDKKIVATFNVLIYQGVGRKYKINNTDQEEYDKNQYDDLFDLIAEVSLLKSSSNAEQSVISSQILKSVQFNKDSKGLAIVQTNKVQGYIEQGEERFNRVIYATDVIDHMNNATDYIEATSPQVSTGSSTVGSVTSSSQRNLLSKFPFYLQEFSDGLETIKGMLLLDSGVFKGSQLIIGITDEENNQIKSIISDQNLIKKRLFLLAYYNGPNQLVSSENVDYQKFKLGIVAEDNLNNINIYLPDQEVVLYSLDNSYYFSKDFSSVLEQEKQQVGNGTFDLTL